MNIILPTMNTLRTITILELKITELNEIVERQKKQIDDLTKQLSPLPPVEIPCILTTLPPYDASSNTNTYDSRIKTTQCLCDNY